MTAGSNGLRCAPQSPGWASAAAGATHASASATRRRLMASEDHSLRADTCEQRAEVRAAHLDAEVSHHARLALGHREEAHAEAGCEGIVVAVADPPRCPDRFARAREL